MQWGNPETFRLSPCRALASPERVLREAWAEIAGAEGFEGAEARGEPAGGETTFAEEAAQEVCGGLVCFARITLDTAGDKVAIGVAAGVHLRDDMVQALRAFFQAAEAVEASVALTGKDGPAQWLCG